MRSCDDGYPSCRYAEASGKWCTGPCQAEIAKEIALLVEKRDQIRETMMSRYHDGTATRARTTTSNADVDRINDRIAFLRQQLKSSQ